MTVNEMLKAIADYDNANLNTFAANKMLVHARSCYTEILVKIEKNLDRGITSMPDSLEDAYRARTELLNSMLYSIKKYGKGTKYELTAYELFNGVSEIRAIMESSWKDVADIIINSINKIGEIGIDRYRTYFNLESYEDSVDHHDIMTDVRSRYMIKPAMVKLLFLGIAIALDKKVVRFDTDKAISKYSKLCNKKPYFRDTPDSYSYTLLVQSSKYTLLNILKHDFRDRNHWPFRDDLGELLADKLSGFNLTKNTLDKMHMVGLKEYKGATLRESIFIMSLKDLLDNINDTLWISYSLD